MTEIHRDKLAAMDDNALEERYADLEKHWKYLERRSDPNGTRTERQAVSYAALVWSLGGAADSCQ